MPAWLAYSVLTILFLGSMGAGVEDRFRRRGWDPNQIFYTLGLLPLILIVLRSPRLRQGTGRRAGVTWAFITGILGGAGNIAFFIPGGWWEAFNRGSSHCAFSGCHGCPGRDFPP